MKQFQACTSTRAFPRVALQFATMTNDGSFEHKVVTLSSRPIFLFRALNTSTACKYHSRWTRLLYLTSLAYFSLQLRQSPSIQSLNLSACFYFPHMAIFCPFKLATRKLTQSGRMTGAPTSRNGHMSNGGESSVLAASIHEKSRNNKQKRPDCHGWARAGREEWRFYFFKATHSFPPPP